MKSSEAFSRAIVTVGLALLLSGQLLMCGGSSPTPCTAKAECYNSAESHALGRCAPREVACVRGTCRVDCPQLCEAVDPATNPCADSMQICNQSKSGQEDNPYCASGPIPCTTADDCPLVRPATATDATAVWTCENGTCQFPGFHYGWE